MRTPSEASLAGVIGFDEEIGPSRHESLPVDIVRREDALRGAVPPYSSRNSGCSLKFDFSWCLRGSWLWLQHIQEYVTPLESLKTDLCIRGRRQFHQQLH